MFYSPRNHVHAKHNSGIVEFRGIMTDCPEKLTTGASLFITLHVYILHAAFKPHTMSQAEDTPIVMFNEGLETVDEKYAEQTMTPREHMLTT